MSDNRLQHHMVEFLALTVSHFNSGFSDDITYTDENARRRNTLLHNWFLPPTSQFPNGFKTEIGAWFLTESQQRDLVTLQEIGRRPAGWPAPALFAPKSLGDGWDLLLQSLGPPQKTYTGYMTPSGRSYWVLGDDETTFGIKFHVPPEIDTVDIMNRTLNAQMIEKTVKYSEMLQSYPQAMKEEYGAFIKLKKANRNFGFIMRDFKWNQLDPVPGDVLLPLQTLLSHAFWRAEEVLDHLGFPDPAEDDLRGWFAAQLAPHMATLMATSLFETGLHPEAHQQNLTVHIGGAVFKNLICQDLQDYLYDPVTRFLVRNVPSRSEPDFSPLSSSSALGLPGEILTPESQNKLFVSLSDWWRRWIRVFGRYDRILNVLCRKDPFEDLHFENEVTTELQKHIERRGLVLTSDAKKLSLYALIAWAQHSYQQLLLQQFYEKHRSQMTPAEHFQIFNSGICLASARAPWSEPLFQRWREDHPGSELLQLKNSAGHFLFLYSSQECHLYFHRPATDYNAQFSAE